MKTLLILSSLLLLILICVWLDKKQEELRHILKGKLREHKRMVEQMERRERIEEAIAKLPPKEKLIHLSHMLGKGD